MDNQQKPLKDVHTLRSELYSKRIYPRLSDNPELAKRLAEELELARLAGAYHPLRDEDFPPEEEFPPSSNSPPPSPRPRRRHRRSQEKGEARVKGKVKLKHPVDWSQVDPEKVDLDQPLPDPELEEQVQQEVPLHPITERERKKDYPPLPWEDPYVGEPVEPTEEDLAELAEMWDWNAFAALEILQYVQNLEEYEQWKREVTEERQRLLRLRRKEVIEEQRRKALAAKKQYEQLN